MFIPIEKTVQTPASLPLPIPIARIFCVYRVLKVLKFTSIQSAGDKKTDNTNDLMPKSGNLKVA